MARIEGYFDFKTDKALVGWIANLDHPDRLEKIICSGEGGETLAFRPFIPRRDVCDAFNMTGRFGFAIPIAALERLGSSSVRLSNVHGIPLRQGEAIALSAPQPPLPELEEPRWVVLHIQKTAGTSLRTALTQSARPGEAVFIYPDGFTGLSPAELGQLPHSQRAALRLVIGHTAFGIADLLPGPSSYVTFLRDPAARLRSHYLHHLAIGAPVQTERGLAEVPAMVSEGMTDEFDNLMVRMVAGIGTDTVPLGMVREVHVELALRHIRERFRFVGLVERMNPHYRTLCELMGVPHSPLPMHNTCRIGDRVPAIMRVDWDRVMQRNRFDTMLYDLVQSEGLCGRDLSLPG